VVAVMLTMFPFVARSIRIVPHLFTMRSGSRFGLLVIGFLPPTG
jgi:hypothetical protein